MGISAGKLAAQHGAAARGCQLEADSWIDRTLDVLLPRLCLGCGRTPAPGGLCSDCRDALPRLAAQCPRCALPLAADHHCGPCLADPPPQQRSWAAYVYAEPLAGLLQQLKFAGALGVAASLGALVAEHDCPLPLHGIDYLVPAPLHLRRLRQRGYNQARELCRPLAARHGLEVRPDLLLRWRETREQTRLNAAQRRRNLRGAFTCTQALDGEHVLLFDDVMTTGATMRAMAEALLYAGAGEISCLAVARAV